MPFALVARPEFRHYVAHVFLVHGSSNLCAANNIERPSESLRFRLEVVDYAETNASALPKVIINLGWNVKAPVYKALGQYEAIDTMEAVKLVNHSLSSVFPKVFLKMNR